MSKDFTAAVILDIEKKIDKVLIFGRIYKLINYNSPQLFFYYLLDRNFHVRVKDQFSRKMFANFGLQQWLNISHASFILFINNMSSYPHTYLAKYADDNCVFSIKKIVNILFWLKKWRNAININKTQAILLFR